MKHIQLAQLLAALAIVADVKPMKDEPHEFAVRIRPTDDEAAPKCTMLNTYNDDWRRTGKKRGRRAR